MHPPNHDTWLNRFTASSYWTGGRIRPICAIADLTLDTPGRQ